MEITFAVILSYISNYLLSFVISLLGAFTTEMMTAMRNKSKINLFRLIAPSIFDGFLMCAALEYFKLDFSVYVLICFLAGMWGLRIVDFFTSEKAMSTMLKSLLRASSSTLAKAASDGLDVLKNEDTPNQKDSSANTTSDEKDDTKERD